MSVTSNVKDTRIFSLGESIYVITLSEAPYSGGGKVYCVTTDSLKYSGKVLDLMSLNKISAYATEDRNKAERIFLESEENVLSLGYRVSDISGTMKSFIVQSVF